MRRAAAWIDSNPARAFFVLTVCYLVAVVILSFFKLLWLDELITLHIARLGSAPAIWGALARGADPNPPLMDLLVMGCLRLFGDHALALRLPAMVGYWVGILSLFAFLRCRLPASWALAGAAMSMAMAAFNYSFESRSYAIVYGLSMLAIYCWSRAVEPCTRRRERYVALLGMTLALAVGVCTNYFAVLAFFPIAGGELVRLVNVRKKRGRGYGFRGVPQIGVWAGLALAATPLLLFRPLIEYAIAEFSPYAWDKVSLGMIANCYMEMVEILLYPLLVLFGFTGVILALARLCRNCQASVRPRWVGRLARHQAQFGSSTLPPHEAVATFLLMSYPILGYIVASIHGGMLSPRFVVPVCFGFAIAGTLASFRLFGHKRSAGMVLLLFCAVWFFVRESVVGYWYAQQKQAFYRVVDHVPAADFPDGPIVIPDPLLALPFRYYAPADLASRVVFPIDFSAVRRYRRDDSAEENLWAGRGRVYHFPILSMTNFQHSAGKYLVLASADNWFIKDLRHHRYPVQRLPIDPQADGIGGFTPLDHGTPVFYVAVGDGVPPSLGPITPRPIPFQRATNLPAAQPGP